MGKRRRTQKTAFTEVLLAVTHALVTREELRAGVSSIEGALDDYQRALNDVRERNEHVWRDRAIVGDLSEDDWLTWDCCKGRIDATVEACRCLGYLAWCDEQGSWHVRFDCGL